jgi:hypothetical protein
MFALLDSRSIHSLIYQSIDDSWDYCIHLLNVTTIHLM